jgi:TfoX/Sxy family transcriptional regulator of competence genes
MKDHAKNQKTFKERRNFVMHLSTTAAGEECYAAIVKALGNLPHVTQWEKKTFGSVGLSIGEKIFAMRVRGQLVIKLRSARVDELIERGVGKRFELGQKRMKEWIALFSASEERCLSLSREAMEYVASQSGKVPLQEPR